MNKAQKITIAVALLIMTFILIYPPIGDVIAGEGVKLVLPEGRNLIFLLQDRQHVRTTDLVVELISIVCFGGALVVLFGLKKRGEA